MTRKIIQVLDSMIESIDSRWNNVWFGGIEVETDTFAHQEFTIGDDVYQVQLQHVRCMTDNYRYVVEYTGDENRTWRFITLQQGKEINGTWSVLDIIETDMASCFMVPHIDRSVQEHTEERIENIRFVSKSFETTLKSGFDFVSLRKVLKMMEDDCN